MKVPFLDLSRQYAGIKDEVEKVTAEVLQSCAYVGGSYVANFEKDMAAYLGCKHVISCANGTDALVLCLRACGIGPGDEVITTPFTFFATAEAIALVGAKPVFVDVRPDDCNIDPEKIEAAITPRCKAILPVHIFGFPAEMDKINALAQKHGLKVIEDAAQAIGSDYKGKKIGNTENLASFSFYPTKNLGAAGDAGMVTTNDDRLATILLALREHGAAKNGAKARELLTGVADEFALESADKKVDNLYNPYKYYNYLIGYNSRLDALQAAILRIKLKQLEGYTAAREKVAARYTVALRGILAVPTACAYGRACFHQYVVKTEQKEALGEFLAARGIGSGAFYPVPLHLQKAFSYLGHKKGDLPVAEKLAEQTVCLPIFPELFEEEADAVIQAIKDFFKTA